MSNLPITNRSSDSKSNSFLSSFFGQKALDNFFQDFSSHFPFSKEFSGLIDTKLDFVTPKVDIVERKKSYELTAELPGLESKDIKLSLSDDILTISGEKKYESDEDKFNILKLKTTAIWLPNSPKDAHKYNNYFQTWMSLP